MEKQLIQIFQSLQTLTGLHRQLLEVVRAEREMLIQADIKGIQNVTYTKQGLIEAIYQAEAVRLKQTSELALFWRKPYRDLTLPNIIIFIQAIDSKGAEQLRSIYNALTLLIQRVSEQNQDNRALLERSIEHVYQMKKNILGEATPRSNTYTHQGQRIHNFKTNRLFSKEA